MLRVTVGGGCPFGRLEESAASQLLGPGSGMWGGVGVKSGWPRREFLCADGALRFVSLLRWLMAHVRLGSCLCSLSLLFSYWLWVSHVEWRAGNDRDAPAGVVYHGARVLIVYSCRSCNLRSCSYQEGDGVLFSLCPVWSIGVCVAGLMDVAPRSVQLTASHCPTGTPPHPP